MTFLTSGMILVLHMSYKKILCPGGVGLQVLKGSFDPLTKGK